MRVSCSTACLSKNNRQAGESAHGRLAAAMREIHEAGYAAAEVAASQIAEAFPNDDLAADEFHALLAHVGLGLSSMTIAPLSTESADDLPVNLEAIRQDLLVARQLGLPSVNVGGGNRRRQPFELLIDGLQQIAADASHMGIQINIANRRDSRLEQLEDVRHVLAHIRAGNVRLLADCGQFHSAAVNPCHAFREFRTQIGLIHITDQVGKRAAPLGQGEMNVPAIVETASRSGYDGWLVVDTEIPEGEDARAYLAAARTYLEALLTA